MAAGETWALIDGNGNVVHASGARELAPGVRPELATAIGLSPRNYGNTGSPYQAAAREDHVGKAPAVSARNRRAYTWE